MMYITPSNVLDWIYALMTVFLDTADKHVYPCTVIPFVSRYLSFSVSGIFYVQIMYDIYIVKY